MMPFPGGPEALPNGTLLLSVVAAVLVVATTSRWGLWWRLITFTYQVNLLAAGYYLWTLVYPRAERRVGLRGAIVLYVVTAGLIWNLFLTGPDTNLIQAGIFNNLRYQFQHAVFADKGSRNGR